MFNTHFNYSDLSQSKILECYFSVCVFGAVVPTSITLIYLNLRFWNVISGSVFLGQWTPESVGDYASGTNHVLPTYGYARMYSGVSLNSFLKYITVQSLSEEGLKKLGPFVAKMAEVEGLEAHKRAVTLRLQEIESTVTV